MRTTLMRTTLMRNHPDAQPPISDDAMTESQEHSSPSPLLSYLRLFRIPNVFTAFADITMGFVFVNHSLESAGVFSCLILATGLLYTAGMVLNDVYDYQVDCKERPFRPIPAGEIPLGWARTLGYAMLVAGMGCAWLAGYVQPLPENVMTWRGGVMAMLLATCIVWYNAQAKRTPAGPLAMGACRFFNILLGMSIAAPAANAVALGFGTHHLIAAGGIGLYITGVTWFARNEAQKSSQQQLTSAFATMAMGVLILGILHETYRENVGNVLSSIRDKYMWWALLVLLMIPIARRCVVAIMRPSPLRVQTAVKQCILSLIMFDAAIAMNVAPLPFALGILALLVPSLLLGKWVYST